MFRDRYKEEMDRIAPSEELRRSVRRKLTAPARRVNRAAIRLRIGTAAVACAALALSVALLPRGQVQAPAGTQPEAAAGDLMQAVTYADIYEAIEPLCVRQNAGGWNLFGWNSKSSASANEIAAEEIYDYSTGVDAALPTEAAGAGNPEAAGENYTATNTQVEGVDEADIVKTDGRYIYSLSGNTVRIVRAEKGRLSLVNTVTLKEDPSGGSSCRDMFLTGDRLVLTVSRSDDRFEEAKTQVVIIDVADPAEAKQIAVCEQSGDYCTSRMIGRHLYMVTNHYINTGAVNEKKPGSFVPTVTSGDVTEPVAPESIHLYTCGTLEAVYTVACAFDVTDGHMTASQSVLGDTGAVYCSTENLLTASYRGADSESGVSYSVVTRFSVGDGAIEYKTNNRVNGSLLNQFSMDEYNGYFRFVTTVDSYHTGESDDGMTVFFSSGSGAALYVLDGSLETVGRIERLAEGERVYSVRFMGDVAYFVTFRQTDPLFSADLSDPTAPRIIGQLKIPGFSDYLFPFGEGELLGIGMDADENTGFTECVKLSMFDITDPADVTEHDRVRVEDVYYSPALYDHRAALIDPERGIVGLYCLGEQGGSYRLYSCRDGFAPLAVLALSSDGDDNVRGLFIGDVFYLVSGTRIEAYSADGFAPMGAVAF